MDVSLLSDSNVTVFNAVASPNAHSPIDVTLAGIVIFPEQASFLITLLFETVNVPVVQRCIPFVPACAGVGASPERHKARVVKANAIRRMGASRQISTMLVSTIAFDHSILMIFLSNTIAAIATKPVNYADVRPLRARRDSNP